MNSIDPSRAHISVLLEESINHLNIQPRDIVVDGTFGGGGHSRAIIEQYPEVTLIAVDLDEAAKNRFEENFSGKSNIHFVQANFMDTEKITEGAGVEMVDKVLLDLGTSTFQLLSDNRGFSFNSDTPLKMTFSESGSHTGFDAERIVNDWEESSIADILYYYGEERKARKIAKAILEARKVNPIKTSGELARIIESVVPRYGRIHPATKTFQALRIAVNDELRVLETALNNWWEKLNNDGRIAVITFHSLEDRIVKKWMLGKDKKRVITKKPIAPSRKELQENPRSRSAKLRVIEKKAYDDND